MCVLWVFLLLLLVVGCLFVLVGWFCGFFCSVVFFFPGLYLLLARSHCGAVTFSKASRDYS